MVMTATDEPRKLLDERGVEHYDHENGEPLRDLGEAGPDPATSWRMGDASVCAVPNNKGTFDLWIDHCTPAQAIEATLGRGNAGRYVGLRQGEYWERTENSDYYCGGCGWKVTDHDSYCPECGGALHKATLGQREQPPYDELIEALRRDWDIEASWDGLRRFWYVGLTDEGVRKRDEREATLERGVTGDTSDGYHTFNELYHHRAVLFSVIVRMMPDKGWKSKLHHTGDMFDGMFIVGIDTPTGQATYHYDIDPYWEMFDCKELERAPEWDGHTPSQAIERIATLGRGVVSE